MADDKTKGMEETTTFGLGDAARHLAEKARTIGWPEDLIEEMLTTVPAPQIEAAVDKGMTADEARKFLAGETPAPAGPQLNLSWMYAKTERGARAKPSKKGLTINDINVGTYGDIPDTWQVQTQLPRGAALPTEALPSLGYSIYDKIDQWADSVGDLYEEAIQRRWAPALDVPWETLQPQSEELERAMCQICTVLSEAALNNVRVLGKWLQEFAYGYHEVKLFLATTVYAYGIHFEATRKRALANGGGLGLESPGIYYRNITDARKWTDLEGAMFLIQGSFIQEYYLTLAANARFKAEQVMFTYMAQDLARHITYVMEQLRMQVLREPVRRGEINSYLRRGEALFMIDAERDVPCTEAFAILLAGGVKDAATVGRQRVNDMRRRGIERYLRRLEWCGLIDRGQQPNPMFVKYLPEPVAVG